MCSSLKQSLDCDIRWLFEPSPLPTPTIHDRTATIHPRTTAVHPLLGFAPFIGRWLPASGDPRHPPAGENGTTVERSSNRLGAAEASRPARLVIGIIGGIAAGPPACPGGRVPTNGIAAAGPVEGAAAAQLDGTDSGPTEVA